MLHNELAHAINRVHALFYQEKGNVATSNQSSLVKFKADQIEVLELGVHSYRVVFDDYYHKIEDFRNLFESIMNHNDNLCDTSDFLLLTKNHTETIVKYIKEASDEILKDFKTTGYLNQPNNKE